MMARHRPATEGLSVEVEGLFRNADGGSEG